MRELNRRQFLEFIGSKSLAIGAAPLLLSSLAGLEALAKPVKGQALRGIKASDQDQVITMEGLQWKLLLTADSPLTDAGAKVGFNNDYLAFIPLVKGLTDEGLLWVNHESIDPFLFHQGEAPRNKATFEREMRAVGGSIAHIKKLEGEWQFLAKSSLNRRLDALTPIPFQAPRAIDGATTAIGTLANCAGGITPWGTVLTCEENYQDYYGDFEYDEKGGRSFKPSKKPDESWHQVFAYSPEHYGWVVEVDVKTGEAKKLVSLGRFSHECATTVLARDGRCVVYTGDDKVGGYIYKFISKRPNSLDEGDLYVADTIKGHWLKLDVNQAKLKGRYKDQTELLIRVRQAAKFLEATPQDRPEDIEIDPNSKAVFITLTGNPEGGNLYGSILRIDEEGEDPTALSFTSKRFVAGGPDSGFSCPDNLAFDRGGNLWMTTDIAPKYLGKGEHQRFGNNGLFYIALKGPQAGRPIQVASAPRMAEFTGPQFSPDGKSLFLSVQHPGEKSTSKDNLLSHWPGGGHTWPKSAVIQLFGPTLERLTKSQT